MNYYIDDVSTSTFVHYKLLAEGGKILRDYTAESCFSALTYAVIPTDTAVVHIYHPKSMLPYKVPEIKRWIKEISEMGFTASFIEEVSNEFEKQNTYVAGTVQTDMCELAQKLLRHGIEPVIQNNVDQYYHFEIKLSDYKYKSHLVSALMLVRCLTETGICKVPEIYFQMLDANPNLDRFDALQTAHKKLHDMNISANSNHMITYRANSANNVSMETLLKNYKNCGVEVLGRGYLGQSVKWRN